MLQTVTNTVMCAYNEWTLNSCVKYTKVTIMRVLLHNTVKFFQSFSIIFIKKILKYDISFITKCSFTLRDDNNYALRNKNIYDLSDLVFG
jgi:hypothetical protein